MESPKILGCLILALDSLLNCGIFLSFFHGPNQAMILGIWLALRLVELIWIQLFAWFRQISIVKAFRGRFAALAVGTQVLDFVALLTYYSLPEALTTQKALSEDYLAIGIQVWFDVKGILWLVTAIYESFQKTEKVEVEPAEQDRSVYERLL